MLLSKQNMTILLMVMSSFLVVSLAKPTVDYCQTCQSISEFIQVMENNQTESVMKMNIFKMCLKENDGKNAKVCSFMATALQNTLKHIGNEDFCTKINACSTRKTFDRPASINNERCDFCSELVQSFKTLTVDSETLNGHLNSFCDMTSDFKDECLDNLNRNLGNFIDFIQNKMDSETFCHATKSCHHQTIEEKKYPTFGDLVALRDPIQMQDHFDFLDNKQVDKDVKQLGALSCIVCNQIVVIVYSQLHKNATREHVEDIIAKSCKAIYFRNKEKEKECEEKVKKNAEKILNGFINKVPARLVCIAMGMCLPGVSNDGDTNEIPHVIDTIQPKISDDKDKLPGELLAKSYKCYFCEKVVEFLFKELDTDRTREYVKKLLGRSCRTLFRKEERQSKCEEYINAYTDKLIDLIEKAQNPGLICNTLHLCEVNSKLIIEWENKKLDSKIDSNTVVNKMTNKPVHKVDWCRICSTAYPVLTQIVQIDAVKDRISNIAHNFCESSVLPIPTENCHKKADQYLEVIRTVKDTQTGCQQINLCFADDKRQQNADLISFDIDYTVVDANTGKVHKLGWWDDLKCNGCKLIVKGLYLNLEKTIHAPHTKQLIEQTCEHLHDENLKQKCIEDAQKALETLLNDLKKNMSPETTCEMLKYCNKKEDTDEKVGKFLQASPCNSCKAIYPFLHNVLQNEQTRQTAKTILAKICEHSNKVEECKKVTSEFIDNYANAESADQACKNVCSNDENNFFKVAFGSRISECTACQASMVALNQIFKNENVQTKLNSTLDKFCSGRVNEESKTNCKEIVRTNLPKFYEMVQNVTDHDTGFCPVFGYCNVKKNNLIDNQSDDLLKNAEDLLKDNMDLLPNKDDDLLDDDEFTINENRVCDACKRTFTKIEEDVKSKANFKNDLLRRLLDTCPQSDDKCREFYNKYINFFYDSLLRNVNPNRACPSLKLCRLSEVEDTDDDENWTPGFNLTESTACKECHSALDYLKNTLENKTVIDFILKEVQTNVCQPLSFLERKACNRLVKKFGPKIVKHFAEKIDKNNICTNKLRLCKDGETFELINSFEDVISFDLLNFKNDPNCNLCLNTVNKLNSLRGYNSRDVKIDDVCDDNDLECRRFMVDFKDFLLNNQNNQDSLIACTELDICLIPGRVQLLGGEKCKYGPAYFCLSNAHSKACNAENFCKQNYWQTVEVKAN